MEALARLTSQAESRLATSFAPRSKGPLNSALNALARFAQAYPSLRMFDHTLGRDAAKQKIRNEWTFILFIEFLMREPSKKTGKPVRVNTIVSYVSLAKGFLAHKYGFDLVDEGPRLRRIVKELRESDPLAGSRKKRRAWRKRHFEQLVRQQPEAIGSAQNLDALNEYAAACTAWHVLARGGELTNGATSGWNAERDPTRSDLTFHTSRSGDRYAVLMLRPLKKKGQAAQPKVPQFIAEHDGGPSDAYAALRRLAKLDPVPTGERGNTPLFNLRRGSVQGQKRPMKVGDLRNLIRRYAHLIGQKQLSQWGAHSFRIGGATDLAATDKCSPALLAAKGRWASDIGNIYARMTRKSQLAASRLMHTAKGRDLEEIIPHFTQGA